MQHGDAAALALARAHLTGYFPEAAQPQSVPDGAVRWAHGQPCGRAARARAHPV